MTLLVGPVKASQDKARQPKRAKCPHCAAKDAEIRRLRDAAVDATKASADHEQRLAQQKTRDGR